MPNPFDARLAEPMTAKRMILSVLSATGEDQSTARLVRFGGLVDIEPAAVRVALGRLVKNGDVVTVARGVHTVGEKGQPILDAIRRWTDLPRLTRPWEGGWILVHTAHLGRTQRAALRRRERALRLFGFAPLEQGLWLRPDNLTVAPAELRGRLVALGMEDAAIVAVASQLALGSAADPAGLWDRGDIESGYQAALSAMRGCLERHDDESLAWRAYETAKIGSAVIGMLTYDPLLPGELVDAEARDEVRCQMLAFDDVGKAALYAFWDAA